MIIKEKHYPYLAVLIAIILAFEMDSIFFSDKRKEAIREIKTITRQESMTPAKAKRLQEEEDSRLEAVHLAQLKSLNPGERRKGLLSLQRYVGNQKVAAAIVERLNDSDMKNRKIVLKIMTRNKLYNYLFQLTEYIKKEDDNILRLDAQNLMIAIGKSRPIDRELFWLISDKNQRTAYLAVQVLLKVYQNSYGYPRVMETGLNSPHADIRRKILKYIERMPAEDAFGYRNQCEIIADVDSDMENRNIAKNILRKNF